MSSGKQASKYVGSHARDAGEFSPGAALAQAGGAVVSRWEDHSCWDAIVRAWLLSSGMAVELVHEGGEEGWLACGFARVCVVIAVAGVGSLRRV